MMITLSSLSSLSSSSTILHFKTNDNQYHNTDNDIPIILQNLLYKQQTNNNNNTNNTKVIKLFQVNTNKIIHNNQNPDYGGLDLTFPITREIHDRYHYYDSATMEDNNNNNNETHVYTHYEFPSLTKCRDVNWRHTYHPNCNLFHEMNIIKNDHVSYINSGFYRDVFLFSNHITNTHPHFTLTDKVVLKTLKLIHNITHENIVGIGTEALIMDKIISTRIMDIYGHCSTTVATEYVDNEIIKSSKT